MLTLPAGPDGSAEHNPSGTNIAANVVMLLSRRIRRGEILPGSRLRQSEVAREYGVSITPVREAFSALQSEGLVEIRPNVGAVVWTATSPDLRETFEIRWTLERLALISAIEKLSPTDLANAERFLLAMETTSDADLFVQASSDFFRTIYRAADMPRLCQLVEGLSRLVEFYVYLVASQSMGMASTANECRKILFACRNRETNKAVESLRIHLGKSENAILNLIALNGTTV